MAANKMKEVSKSLKCMEKKPATVLEKRKKQQQAHQEMMEYFGHFKDYDSLRNRGTERGRRRRRRRRRRLSSSSSSSSSNKCLLSQLDSNLTLTFNIYSYNTRYATNINFYKPCTRTNLNIGKQSAVSSIVVDLWQDLSTSLKNLTLLHFQVK